LTVSLLSLKKNNSVNSNSKRNFINVYRILCGQNVEFMKAKATDTYVYILSAPKMIGPT